MAKKKEDIMIKIRDDNPEYNFVREDFLPDTGRVVLIPEWNFRNSKCEIPEGADLIDFCIKKAMQNNKNYKEILDDLVENEYSNTDYQRPKVLDIVDVAKAGYLGIQGVDSNYGVYVYKVFAGSAAEKAGLSVGDIIVEFEGNEISTMNQLKELLSYYAAGETVDFVTYKAKGNEYVETKVTVTLGDASTVQQ